MSEITRRIFVLTKGEIKSESDGCSCNLKKKRQKKKQGKDSPTEYINKKRITFAPGITQRQLISRMQLKQVNNHKKSVINIFQGYTGF